VWGDLRAAGDLLEVPARAEAVIDQLQARLEAIGRKTRLGAKPTVAAIEWVEPLMAAGNWVPELIELAGGQSLFAAVGQHSPWLEWDQLCAADPEVIVLMPCGFTIERTVQDVLDLVKDPRWLGLSAVQRGAVYTVDGHHYFNRPGPRLVESAEILAEILHPDLFNFGHRGAGWIRMDLHQEHSIGEAKIL
jgi:iron complex transport system substrate-binding protein